MSAEQAKAHLATFLAETPASLAALRKSAAEHGQYAELLDLSVASLDPLWQWVTDRVAWRAGYRPPASSAEPPMTIDPARVEPAELLPFWFHSNPAQWATFSFDTLWLTDRLGRYLGEVLVAHAPRAKWKVGRSAKRNYIYQNHPVISGVGGDEIEPIETAGGLIHKHLMNRAGPTPRQRMAEWLAR
ncbi:MAG TPA: hypothetical protein VGB74_19620 [Actinoplanes sp.]